MGLFEIEEALYKWIMFEFGSFDALTLKGGSKEPIDLLEGSLELMLSVFG